MKFILAESLTLPDYSDPYPVNINYVGVLATLLNTVALQPATLCEPNLVIVVQTSVHIHDDVTILVAHMMYF